MLKGAFAVCRLPQGSPIPEWSLREGFFSITRTVDELSVVCLEVNVPADERAERGWSCLQLQGPFPFAMSGVLAAFLKPLANAEIGIFAISTFDTDYVLVKANRLKAAISTLERAGHIQSLELPPPTSLP